MTAVWLPFRLAPDDVLFFRDGRPSSRGTDHYLRSLFPPHPSTLYGALRTRRLVDAGVDLRGIGKDNWNERLRGLEPELGAWGGFGTLEMRGPWLVRERDGREAEPLLPAPADLVVTLREDTRSGEPRRVETVARLRPREDEGERRWRRWSHPLARLTPYTREGDGWRRWPENVAEPGLSEGWYLTPAGLDAWRRGGVPAADQFVDASELWTDEARTGLGLLPQQRSSETGQLYTFGFIRLRQGVALGFDVQGGKLTQDGRIRLGGEGRTAELFPGPGFPKTEVAGGGELVTVSFATPALSGEGAYPPGFAPDRLEGELDGVRCRLVAAVLPGYVTVGGWDVAIQAPKPLRRAIPAGAVFLFQPLAGSAADLASRIDGSCLSDHPKEGLAKQGFGLVMAGVC